MDTVDSAITKPKPVHRLEVFTGAGRRRTWTDEDKARIVAEIGASGESISAGARRHGLSPQPIIWPAAGIASVQARSRPRAPSRKDEE